METPRLLITEDSRPHDVDYHELKETDSPSSWKPRVALLSALAGLLVVTVLGMQNVQLTRGLSYSTATPVQLPYAAGEHLAFVHLFEWDWPSVASECENWLAPKGYSAVQISPATESMIGDTWWTRYQPASHKLISRSGDEAQLAEMIRRCNSVGVMVVFDAVLNHMAQGTGKGIAGSTYSGRNYPDADLTSSEDFHHSFFSSEKNCVIQDYDNQHQVQFCDLGGLPDLCTECNHTRAKVVSMLHKVASMGSRVGFRIDAAKHQDPKDLGKMLKDAGSHWNFQEVIYGQGEAVTPEMYIQNGLVTEFRYAWRVAPLFRGDGDKFSRLDTVGEDWGMIPSPAAVTFTDNHDTQRSDYMNPLTFKDGDLYYLFVIFTLATPYGRPKVMSSYDFNSFDQGPPSYPANLCSGGWRCDHRRTDVANMVEWRRLAGQSGIENVAKDASGDHIAFSRGSAAFIALNRGDDPWDVSLSTGLPAGEYCNVVVSNDLASCPRVKVEAGGIAKISVPSIRAVALHTSAVVSLFP